MKTRLGCLSNKSDSYSDFTAFLSPKTKCMKFSTEEVIRWAESFNTLLSHKCTVSGLFDGLAAFRAFLKTEFSEENIEFCMACEDYKQTKSATKLINKAPKIYEEFIDFQAPREWNTGVKPEKIEILYAEMYAENHMFICDFYSENNWGQVNIDYQTREITRKNLLEPTYSCDQYGPRKSIQPDGKGFLSTFSEIKHLHIFTEPDAFSKKM